MSSGSVQHRGVIDWSGSPGGPSVNGSVGEGGVNGAISTDSSPGKDGGPGKPGVAGFMGQPGANGREMYIVLEEASDEQHVRVKVANQTSDYALPLLLRSNGGLGAAGGNGGPGGVGGIGGDGCNYVAHEERRKYKWQLIGGFGISKSEPASSGRKRAGSQAAGSQAQVGVQVSGEVTKGPIAGPATSLPAIPPGIPSAANKKKLCGYLEHLAWDNTLWRASLAEDGASFIIVRNGQTSISNGLHILDWHGEPWVVTVENHNTFVYSPPDPTAVPARPTFRVGAMQYLDWFSTPCEVKFKENVIAPVMKLSNGGHGGQGGPGGAAGAGAPGGDGGNISIATVNPALLLNVYTESFGGSGGLAGLPGPGGKGGAGGKGQVNGMVGPDGVAGLESPPGVAGKKGTTQYLRLDASGQVIQRGSKKPELKLVSIETKCVSGSAILETTERACITLKFMNIGDISCPPKTLVNISNTQNMLAKEGFVIEEWLDPNVEFTVKLFIELGALPGTASFDLTCSIHGGILYRGSHELKELQHPVTVCTILNTPHVSAGQEIELGAIIQNMSGIATGSVHKRDIRAEIVLEPGLVFMDPPSGANTLSVNGLDYVEAIEDIRETPERILRRVTFSPDLPAFSSKAWSFRLFWKDIMVGEVKGKVKVIPAYDAEEANDADALIITHPGFTNQSFTRLLSLFAEYKLKVVVWDYYFYKGVKISNPFRSKLVVFILRDGADIELLSTDHIRHHFYGDDGSDQDSSLLLLSPDPSETVALLNRRLIEVGHEATEEETTKKFFSKPDSKDFHELVHEIEKHYFPTFPDYYVWSVSKENAVKTSNGMRAKYNMGEVKILRATLSYFHRLYVMPCNFVTNDVITKAEASLLEVALRHSLTLSHKIFLIETDTRPNSAAITEAALYYDLKCEFFFLPRPLTFLKQITDLLFQYTYRYATERIVEAVLRCLYRLRAATYWKSFGFSDFKPKFTSLENILKRLKETLSSFAFELENTASTSASGAKRRLDFAAIDSKAQSGAKSSARVKWRKQTLPLRLREIPEKEDMKVAPPADMPSGSAPPPSFNPAFRDSSDDNMYRHTQATVMPSTSASSSSGTTNSASGNHSDTHHPEHASSTTTSSAGSMQDEAPSYHTSATSPLPWPTPTSSDTLHHVQSPNEEAALPPLPVISDFATPSTSNHEQEVIPPLAPPPSTAAQVGYLPPVPNAPAPLPAALAAHETNPFASTIPPASAPEGQIPSYQSSVHTPYETAPMTTATAASAGVPDTTQAILPPPLLSSELHLPPPIPSGTNSSHDNGQYHQ